MSDDVFSYKHRIFENDDFSLKLEYSDEYLSQYTDLSPEEIEDQFQTFGRLFFNDVISKSRKDFHMEYDNESEKWVYYIKKAKPTS